MTKRRDTEARGPRTRLSLRLEIEEIPFGEDAVRLAALRAESGLTMPDCCVLLAAQDAAADAVLTFDDALAREVERLGLRAG